MKWNDFNLSKRTCVCADTVSFSVKENTYISADVQCLTNAMSVIVGLLLRERLSKETDNKLDD